MIYRVITTEGKFVTDIYDDHKAKRRYDNLSQNERMVVVSECQHNVISFPDERHVLFNRKPSTVNWFEND